jgi:hypothetical protein
VNNPFRPQPGRPDVVRHQKLNCRACGNGIDAAGVTGPVAPDPTDGDYSICFRCGEVSIYTIGPLGVALREPTGAELAEFSSNPDNTRLVRTIHRYWASKA